MCVVWAKISPSASGLSGGSCDCWGSSSGTREPYAARRAARRAITVGVTRRLVAVAVVLVALAAPAAAQAGTPEFHGTIKTIGPKIKARMVSWHEGCPV